jgi:ribosomal protein L37AE/L43A
MTTPIGNSAKCTRCGEELAAPAWSGHVSVEEVREFWCCSKCGYMFETLTPIPASLKLEPELIEAFLPNLLVA